MAAVKHKMTTKLQRMLMELATACLFVLFFGCQTTPKANIGEIAGLWQTEGNMLYYEHWAPRNDSVLEGRGFSLNGSDTLFSEKLKIETSKGAMTYFAQVSDQNKGAAIPFPLVKQTKNSWIFENPQHDYPNRIIYTLLNDSTLDARIENIRGKKAKTFHFKRIR